MCSRKQGFEWTPLEEEERSTPRGASLPEMGPPESPVVLEELPRAVRQVWAQMPAHHLQPWFPLSLGWV